jgi:hypothetical protein
MDGLSIILGWSRENLNRGKLIRENGKWISWPN